MDKHYDSFFFHLWIPLHNHGFHPLPKFFACRLDKEKRGQYEKTSEAAPWGRERKLKGSVMGCPKAAPGATRSGPVYNETLSSCRSESYKLNMYPPPL